MTVIKRKGRPKGSRNKTPSVLESLTKRPRLLTLSLTRECLKIIHARAEGSGLSPQMVLEDLIVAGDYTMGPAYDNLTNFRNRIRQKATTRDHVIPVTSVEATGTNGHVEPGHEGLVELPIGGDVARGTENVPARSDDAPSERGHRPEDNPAFRDPSAIGDVVGTAPSVVAEMTMAEAGDWARDQLASRDLNQHETQEFTQEELEQLGE